MMSSTLTGIGQAQSLGLTPGYVDIKFTPGHPVSFDMEFTNASSTPMRMHASVTDWGFNEKNEKTFPAPGTLPHSAANWIEVVPREFTVAAGLSAKFRVMVTPPAKAAGGYYCAVFAESAPVLSQESNEAGEAVYANIRLGTLVMLTADRTEEYMLDVGATRVTPPAASTPLTLALTLDNLSNTHVFARAEMAILGANHKLVAKAKTEPLRLLPDQKSDLSITSSAQMPPGEYTALVTVVYGDKHLSTKEVQFTVEPAP
jgi:hypothetical protein